jgi:two-component system, chemotaxis family, sensor kinase CheA
MNDELLNIFREEAQDHLSGLNDALLSVEMAEGATRHDLLKEMNRLAHSLKGAARAVGYDVIERISHAMEEILHVAYHEDKPITPEAADTLYDGLDIIQNMLTGSPNDEAIISEVITALNALAGLPADGQPKPSPVRSKNKRATQDSEELPAVSIKPPPPPVSPFTNGHDELEIPRPAPTKAENSLMAIFREEAADHLAALNDSLMQVEMLEGDARLERLTDMNRFAHTLKGAARAVGLGLIETISHYLEEIFLAAQQGRTILNADTADWLYDGLDLIQQTLDNTPASEDVIAEVLMHLEQLVLALPDTLSKPLTRETGLVEPDVAMRKPRRDAPPPAPEPAPKPRKTTQVHSTTERTLEAGAVPPFSMGPAAGDAHHPPVAGGSTTNTQTLMLRPPEETIRVSVGKLDSLMAEASELIVARMQGETHERSVAEMRRLHARWRREWRSVRTAYIRMARRMQEMQTRGNATEVATLFRFLQSNEDYLTQIGRELAQLSQRLIADDMHLGALADNLQDTVAALRMMPFETILGGFQRMVRDLARDTGKQVHLDISGANAEIDKTVLDALKDPLMHLLRNAVDHGIEPPSYREAVGKSPVGHVLLGVEQRGTEIVIRVQDDGHGLDLAKIRRKAVSIGLLSEAEANAMSDDDARMLIFESGFSTSDQVTAISGRGLGMDIVRDRVESLRGRVHVQSTPGEGTTTLLNVPVSLTRIRAILLRAGEEDYAVPSTLVMRMQSLPRSEIFTAEGREMIQVNERPMPLVSLAALLEAPGAPERGEDLNIMALQSGDKAVAFEVEKLYSETELVLKPLGREIANVPFISGAALLGSGDVMLILDASALVRQASGSALPTRRIPLGTSGAQAASRRLRVLVVDDSITTRTLEKNILEAVGFEVLVAIDGEEAWDVLSGYTPDVIISDVEMPKMNGLELARRVKSHTHTRDIPLVLLTSLGKPEQREEGLRAGADAYLVKSRFDQGELLETIRSVIE